MPNFKLKDLTKAEKEIQSFATDFKVVVAITNQKGMWTCRLARSHVQVMLVTGESLYDCLIKTSEKVILKKEQLGK